MTNRTRADQQPDRPQRGPQDPQRTAPHHDLDRGVGGSSSTPRDRSIADDRGPRDGESAQPGHQLIDDDGFAAGDRSDR